jgi:hypothetical protein
MALLPFFLAGGIGNMDNKPGIIILQARAN